ncbi:hypothetical protein LTR78_007439 [Recurvomyces mirabilis]|uniref:Uncharacterized protein n=2 Tax=Recurvomyces mirabilis TaxID=574656 RepID=A0AAE0TRU7_9PEZI|nr:hypothetical protein LTR78_007439 [Recurvomyces mirabilis]
MMSPRAPWVCPPKTPYPYEPIRTRASTPPGGDESAAMLLDQSPDSTESDYSDCYPELLALSPSTPALAAVHTAYDRAYDTIAIPHQNSARRYESGSGPDRANDEGCQHQIFESDGLVSPRYKESGSEVTSAYNPSSIGQWSEDDFWQVETMSMPDHTGEATIAEDDLQQLIEFNADVAGQGHRGRPWFESVSVVGSETSEEDWMSGSHHNTTAKDAYAENLFQKARFARNNSDAGNLSQQSGTPLSLKTLADAARQLQETEPPQLVRSVSPYPCNSTTGKRIRSRSPEGMPAAKARCRELPHLVTDIGQNLTLVRGPTPVSPARCFTDIAAEKTTGEGKMYKVIWRESWVHESKLPSLSPVRQHHIQRFGCGWQVHPYESR